MTAGVRIALGRSPAFNGDAADPDVVYYGGTYYAFTTGTALGNHIQVLISTSPTGGYHCTGSGSGCSAHPQYGSTALPSTPGWEQPNTSTSPSVVRYGGHWLMFYDAALAGHAAGTGYDCLSVAVATNITPRSPVFRDTSSRPLECMPTYGAVLDPAALVDPTSGKAYLIWKSNDGASTQPTRIWSEQLNLAGTGFAAGSSPREILYNNTARFPYDTTMDDPFMVRANNRYFLMFTVGLWTSSTYREAFASCTSPLGGCTQSTTGPFTNSYAGAYGPGGGSLFQDQYGDWYIDYEAWASSTCQNYSCGGERRLWVATFDPGGHEP
jgi:hypothetical protein